MNITYGQGAFFMAEMEKIWAPIPEAVGEIKAMFDKLLGFGAPEYMEIADLAVAGYCPSLEEIERAGWHSAAAFARSRMAARAQAFARQMEHQKARQALKRRKLLHSDGSFPD